MGSNPPRTPADAFERSEFLQTEAARLIRRSRVAIEDAKRLGEKIVMRAAQKPRGNKSLKTVLLDPDEGEHGRGTCSTEATIPCAFIRSVVSGAMLPLKDR